MKSELTTVVKLFKEKRYEQALNEALKLRDKNPNYTPVKSLLGVLYLTIKDLGAAQKSFEEVLLHDPNNFDALSNLGVIYLEFGKIQPAIQRFVEALSIDPDHPQLLTNLGNAYLRQNEFEAAIQCYEKAIDILPDLFTARLNLALAHKNAGQNSLGLKALDDLLLLQPSNANALFSYGNILRDNRDYEGAVTKFAEAISHQPEFTLIAI